MQTKLVRQLEILLASGAERAGFECAELSQTTRVELARQVYVEASAAFGDSPHDIAAALAPPVRVSFLPRLPDACGEVTIDGAVMVRESSDRRLRGLYAFHGLAHVVLRRAGLRHSHLDVWLLTFEFACPWREIEALGPDVVARYAHLPERLTALWLPIAVKSYLWRESA